MLNAFVFGEVKKFSKLNLNLLIRAIDINFIANLILVQLLIKRRVITKKTKIILISNIFDLEIFPSDIYFLDKLPTEINVSSIFLVFLISIIISAIASYLPAKKISKMNTFRALRYE